MISDGEQEDRSPTEVYRSRSGEAVLYPQQDGISAVQLVNVLLRHRWKVVATPAVLAALVVVVTVIAPPTYTSDASFVPQTGGASGQLSQLSGFASQFGIDVPMAQSGQSPQFYADLLTSRRLLEKAVTSSYVTGREVAETTESTVRADANSSDTFEIVGSQRDHRGRSEPSSALSLVDLYEVDAPTRVEAIAKAAERLEEAVSVSTNTETGVVELSVTAMWPSVSKQIVERLIELVNRFNNRVRQSQASAQAEFVGERLEEAERELRTAEDSLEAFLQRNVGWQQSPELRFRHDRLQRRVNLKQQVYTSLASRYEEARIDEVRSTPVVSTVTEPQVPPRPDPKRLLLKAVLGLMVGGIVGTFWAFGSELAARTREVQTEDYREFVSLKQDAVEDVRQAGHRIRRLLGSGSEDER